ncbi:RPAP1-like protein [Xylariaceae sp. FL0255]|nr:RPAP1-like protein [Xylariaceae sp. FL0255]
MASSGLIFDIKEKDVSKPEPPSFPQIKSSTSGFPEHKKRTKISAFKQKRQGIQPGQKPTVSLSSTGQPIPVPAIVSPPPPPTSSTTNPSGSDGKSSIDRENSQRLASMSLREIEEARQELFNGLDPSILEMLLKRANLDDGANTSSFDSIRSQTENTTTSNNATESTPEIKIENTTSSGTDSKPVKKRVGFKLPDESDDTRNETAPEPTPPEGTNKPLSPRDPLLKSQLNPPNDDDSAPSQPPADQIINPSTPSESAHWPRPRQPADLDPADPNFLQNLHEKYFPHLPADPSKLAWMAPVPTENSPADLDSPYHPRQETFPISSLRFDFRGALLPPRIARVIPTTKGLHHHGEAPESAGYTIRELGRLCRSSVPGQRCVAYQTLGRILYRLGKGEFGSEMGVGIWRQMDDAGVMRSLYDESGLEEGRGHRSARVFATEAVWLFEKGGWKERLRKIT